MEYLSDFIKILLPAAAVMYAMYLTVKAFVNKELEKAKTEERSKEKEITLPARLQAYERMTLFLERISPYNLLLRIDSSEINASQFQQVLLQEIRQEFNHNLAQQIYVSEKGWQMVVNAKEEVIAIINHAASQVQEDARAMELARKVFDQLSQYKNDPPPGPALSFLKKEIQELF